MKTLGQIAYEACHSEDMHWSRAGPAITVPWEAAAQAVRAQVIEECAKVCDEWASECITSLWKDCAEAIAEDLRLLKEKKETT
jgi:hypothetical protein